MANYSQLKADIAAVVKTNGEQEITGANLQQVLVTMITNSVGTGYLYKGVATPSTSVGTPDQNVFYLAGTGTYTNFGGSHVVTSGSLGIFSYNGTWAFETISFTNNDAVLYSPQSKSSTEQTQARANIGLGDGTIDDVPTPGSDNLVKSGGVYSTIRNVQEGNLVQVEETVTPITIANESYVENIVAMYSSDVFTATSGAFRMHYFQVQDACRLDYKLGSGNSPSQCAIVVSSEVPAVGVSYTNKVARESGSEGHIDIAAGKYVCVQVYPNTPAYYPQSLTLVTTETTTINVLDELGKKNISSTIVSDNLWGATEEINQKVDKLSPNLKIPFLIESASYFWMRKQAVNFSQSLPFNISCSANSSTISVISGGQTTSVLTLSDTEAAVVIKHDDGHCTPHILTSWTEDTLTIFPAVDEAISNGLLVPLLADTQHLTKLGFCCWSEHLYAANPRYCEKNLYIARYAPADTFQVPPFTTIGSGLARYDAARNDNKNWLMQYGNNGASYLAYSDKSTVSEYGIEWAVDTGAYRGYLEAMIGTCYEQEYTPVLTKDSGYEMHIEVYADNVKIYDYLKRTNHVERICVPYSSSQHSIKLKVYYTQLRAHKESISIGAATMWVNKQITFPAKMFPDNSILSWFMASWGEFSYDTIVTDRDAANFPDASDYPTTDQGINYKEYKQGASGSHMRDLISAASGIKLPIFIRSKAGTTTRFGKAWWPFLVQPYNPNIMVTSFGVNDYHTNTNPGQFPDVLDPYGGIIDMSTPILPSEYADNIKQMIDMCHMNGITFIHAEGSIAQSFSWLIALENNLSTQVAI